MFILVACDKFRGSLTAVEANDAVLAGLSASALDATAQAVAIADGGEGTLDALSGPATERMTAVVAGPFGAPVEADWLVDRPTRRAIIEVAAVAGHASVRGRGYDPDVATSAGIGELVRAALDAGARRLVVTLGGSVTVDGGAGALEELGATFLDGDGRVLGRPAGRALLDVRRVELAGLDPRLADATFELAADVDNPLTGPDGAAAVFGPQKGVACADVAAFDAALAHLDRMLADARGSTPLAHTPFAGAAGGLMVGLSAAAPTVARDGFALVSDHQDLDARIARADLVVTGEGSLDDQSLAGKGPIAVARAAAARGVPAIAFAGRLAADDEALRACGVVAAFALARGPASLEEALASAAGDLQQTARAAFDLIAAARRA
ncbi:glycerate kinase [Acuticoccus sp.]|uniref:glycerate kinase n=1 Tax=Acuticoccus sp. TaxID=1904378 RepID=UPI003B5159AE